MCKILKNPFLIFLIAIPYFFCMNYYAGIRIDGILYTLQVIHKWHPERFVNDPPFMFGNQDSFSIFTNLYEIFLRYLPVDIAALSITFCMQLAFAIAFIIFVRNAACKYDFEHWTLPIVLAFFTIYISGSGKTVIFFSRLVEPYPVPRTLSIAFAILGLAAIFYNRKCLSIIFISIGAAFHPLMAGWGIPVWVFFYFPKTILPTAVVSALFPLAGYIGVEPFASYPVDWCYKPLTYGPNVEYCLRYIAYISFFILAHRQFLNGFSQKLCKTVLAVTVISFYWYLWTGVNHFILLYQFQVWRMEWLCIVATFLLFAISLHNVYLRYVEKRSLMIRDISLPLLALTLFSDSHFVDGLILAFILYILPNREVEKKIVLGLGVCFAIMNILSAGILYLFSLDLLPVFAKFTTLNNLSVRYTLITAGFCILYSLYSLKERCFFPLILSALFLLFPNFMILPIIVMCYPWLKKWQLVVAILIAAIDGIWGFPMRNSTIFLTPLERTQMYFIIVFFSFGVLSYLAVRKGIGMFAYAILCSLLLVFIPYMVKNYDVRKDAQKKEESAIEQYKNKTVFSQVKDRGKMFFYINGFLTADSRLQFLTGNYIDQQSIFGEIFYKMQFTIAENRLTQLLYKEKKHFENVENRGLLVGNFFKDSLAHNEIFIDRMNYLCHTKEILCIVTDNDQLPFAKQDSTTMKILDRKIFLYGCSIAEN